MVKHAVTENYIYMIKVYEVNETMSEISHLTDSSPLLAFTVCLFTHDLLVNMKLNELET